MSLLKNSGRSHRLYVLYILLALGGVGMLASNVYISLAGTFLTLVALGAAWMTITCPNCGDKWLLHFMRTSSIGAWLNDLQSMRACPRCGYETDT